MTRSRLQNASQSPFAAVNASGQEPNTVAESLGRDGTPQGEFEMKRQPRILAGTALGLLMASAPLGAYPLQGSAAFGTLQRTATPLILAQSNCESAEACAQ